MRPPRFRLRTLLVAVAVVGAGLWSGRLIGSRRGYAQRAQGHGSTERSYLDRAEREERFARDLRALGYRGEFGRDFPDLDRYRCRATYHDALRRKYERAAARPWLPVAPDPPEPD